MTGGLEGRSALVTGGGCLLPTDATALLVVDEPTSDDSLAQMPLGRTGEPEEVADASRFLAGDESAWMTGQVFAVDGGHSLRRGPDLDHLLGDPFEDELQRRMS